MLAIKEVKYWLGEEALPWTTEEVVKLVEQQEMLFQVDFTCGGGAFMSPQQAEEIEYWQWSVAGTAVRERVMSEAWAVMEAMKKTGLAAHDWRHMIRSTQEVGEELELLGERESWKWWAIVAEMMHDWGHVIEAKLVEADRAVAQEFKWGNDLHARLSFLAVEKFWEDFPDVPEKIKQLVSYAVHEHTGKPGVPNGIGELTALVQSGDRSQLINSEAFYRFQQ